MLHSLSFVPLKTVQSLDLPPKPFNFEHKVMAGKSCNLLGEVKIIDVPLGVL